MLDILHPYFNMENFASKTKLRKQETKLRKQDKPNYILRDDLDKKKPTNKLKRRGDKAPAEAMPLLQKEKELEREQSHRLLLSGEERKGMKVKILMTKEEAARLLSKCRDGGVLEFRDVARELVQIPASRVSVVSSGKGEDRVLRSIPEES